MNFSLLDQLNCPYYRVVRSVEMAVLVVVVGRGGSRRVYFWKLFGQCQFSNFALRKETSRKQGTLHPRPGKCLKVSIVVNQKTLKH